MSRDKSNNSHVVRDAAIGVGAAILGGLITAGFSYFMGKSNESEPKKEEPEDQ